jgi:hypothetical protein
MSSPPFLLRLPLHRRRGGVLHLDPVLAPAATIDRAETLADDALASERTSMVEDYQAVVMLKVLIQADAVSAAA